MWLIIGLLFVLYALWMVAAVLSILDAFKVFKLLKKAEVIIRWNKDDNTENVEDDSKQEVTQNE